MRVVEVAEAEAEFVGLLEELRRAGEPVQVVRNGVVIATFPPASDAESAPTSIEPGAVLYQPGENPVLAAVRWRDEMARRYPALKQSFDLRAARDAIS